MPGPGHQIEREKAKMASGLVVQVEPSYFLEILSKDSALIVVHAEPRLFAPQHRYLTSYKGIGFYAISKTPLDLPTVAEMIEAKRLSVPELY
jgi:hypothetical protein